jgi:hypothetical protein
MSGREANIQSMFAGVQIEEDLNQIAIGVANDITSRKAVSVVDDPRFGPLG